MSRPIALLVAAELMVAALAAAPALAEKPTPAPPPGPIVTLDTPGDNHERAERLFLSPSGEPFRAAPDAPDPFEAWFAQADANHDGVIDRAEFRADAVRFFKKLDTNNDGVIDGFEITAYETKIVPEMTAEAEGRFPDESSEAAPPPGGAHDGGGKGDGDKDSGGHHGPGRAGTRGIVQLLEEAEPVSGADFDLQGRVTLANWMRATDERFDLLDTTKTGHLTHDQLKALVEKKEKQKPKR
jgi:hypothetical protein